MKTYLPNKNEIMEFFKTHNGYISVIRIAELMVTPHVQRSTPLDEEWKHIQGFLHQLKAQDFLLIQNEGQDIYHEAFSSTPDRVERYFNSGKIINSDLTQKNDAELQQIMRDSIDNSYVPSSIYNKARLELEIRAMNSNNKSDNKKDKKTKKTKKATLEEWLHFSWSYLELAEIACDYWNIRLKDIKNFNKNYPNFSEPTNVRSFLPLVFNIKHSLELFLKRIAVSFNKNINYSHDLKELSDYIVNLDWKIVRDKIKKLKSKGDGTIEVANKICGEKNLLESETGELVSIIDRYYHIYPISEKISKNITFHDTENTAFKYPENNLLVSFDYADLTEKISSEDFLKVKNDIEKIKKIYSDIGFVLRIYAEN